MTAIDLSLLERLTLSNGSHEDREDGVCAMEAAAYIAGEPHSDHPTCVSPVITSFMINWNDSLPDDAERDRLLKPLIPLTLNTRTSPADEDTRGWLAFDWLARVCTPAWLRLAGLTEEAQLLEGTARIVDAATCDAAMPALGRARQRAAAASAAARDAAWAAARAAAWAAASDAASDALRPTVAALQDSASELVRQMCAVGRKAAA